MKSFDMSRLAKIAILLSGTGLLILFIFLNRASLVQKVTLLFSLIKEPERVRSFVQGWGPIGAPLAFMGLQVMQVIFAPFPGEASGFVGGYVFGSLPGFIYSSIGLTVGSLINFIIARILGRRFVKKWIPSHYLCRFDSLAKHQGVIVFFLFFVIPGFPKDYLCFFLGLTSLSAKIFILMVTIGRMPGTLMLSIQGAQLFQKDYLTLIFLIIISLAILIPVYCWRKRIYLWIDQANPTNNSKNPEC
jgi:uncharacterized membrane protein YdjX (TVP38/TMEM64 family)